jgi:hypothetical protein
LIMTGLLRARLGLRPSHGKSNGHCGDDSAPRARPSVRAARVASTASGISSSDAFAKFHESHRSAFGAVVCACRAASTPRPHRPRDEAPRDRAHARCGAGPRRR